MPNPIISRIKLGGVLYDIKDTTYSVASLSNTTGLLKLGYVQSGQNYPVQVSETGEAFVNVPWDSGSNTTYKATINGSVVGDSVDGVDLGAWYAPTVVGTAGQYLISSGNGAPQWSNFPTAGAALGGIKSGYSNNGGNWGVQVVQDGNDAGKAYVNIPIGSKSDITSSETSGKIWTGAVLTSWMDDILGISADAVSALVNELSDNNTATGILKALTQKADKASLVTYTNGTGLTKATSPDGLTVTFDLKTGYARNGNNFGVSTSATGAFATVPDATTSAPGVMSAADKTKVDTGLVCTYDSDTETMEITWGAAPVAEPVTES